MNSKDNIETLLDAANDILSSWLNQDTVSDGQMVALHCAARKLDNYKADVIKCEGN